MANKWWKKETVRDFILGDSKITQMVTAAMKLKDACSLGKTLWRKQRHHFADKGLYTQSYGFSSSHVWMWELNHKEGWMLKDWCFWTVVLEETLESSLDCKEIKAVNPKENQTWIFIGKSDAKAEAPVPWPSDFKSWLIRKDPDAGKNWRQEEKGTVEDKVIQWHHWLNGHEFERAPGDDEGQGSLACCSPWVSKSWTLLSNWTAKTTWLKSQDSNSLSEKCI